MRSQHTCGDEDGIEDRVCLNEDALSFSSEAGHAPVLQRIELEKDTLFLLVPLDDDVTTIEEI